MHCYDLEVMSSNPGRVELGVLGTSVLSRTLIKTLINSNRPVLKQGVYIKEVFL